MFAAAKRTLLASAAEDFRMLALRCTALALMFAPLLACGEEHPNPLVNDDVSWQLGCGDSAGDQACNTFSLHDQGSEKVQKPFVVACKKLTTGFEITLTDKGDAAASRPSSVLRIENLNPKTGSCSVFVNERSQLTDAQDFKFSGQCSAGDCEVSTTNGTGWDWEGTIKCTNLTTENGEVAPHTLVKSALSGSPVSLAVDNCD
jgi:hypothetical protein